MNGIYDIIIVGAGPAGMFAAHEQQGTRADCPGTTSMQQPRAGILVARGITGNLEVDNYGY